jgi:Tol biopolymer transport system component
VTNKRRGAYHPDRLPDAWSPDGRWIAFDCSTGRVGHICAVRPDGSGRTMILTKRLNAGFPAWRLR